MTRWIKRLICRVFGHQWESYAYMPKGGYWPTDMEQAGHCKRCDADTHEPDFTFQGVYTKQGKKRQ